MIFRLVLIINRNELPIIHSDVSPLIGSSHNPLYSDGFFLADTFNKNVIVHFIFKGVAG